MNVEIQKINTKRFVVRAKYDNKLLEIIRTIKKRFWDKEKNEWHLPIECMDQFIEECKQYGMNVDFNTHAKAFVNVYENTFDIKFSNFTKCFDELLKDTAFKYDSQKGIISALTTYLSKAIEVLDKEEVEKEFTCHIPGGYFMEKNSEQYLMNLPDEYEIVFRDQYNQVNAMSSNKNTDFKKLRPEEIPPDVVKIIRVSNKLYQIQTRPMVFQTMRSPFQELTNF